MRRARKPVSQQALPTLLLCVAAAVLSVLWSSPAAAQASGLENGPPPPPAESAGPPPAESQPAPAKATDASKAGDSESNANLPEKPVWDPLHANRSLEVGTFYLKKGDVDAAIDRFEEAARLQPGLAKPFLLLGEAYEKKDDSAKAVAAYRKYLDLYRKAPDHDKIMKRIAKLERTEREAARRGSG